MTTKASKLKLVECFEFKASEDEHRKHINSALDTLENIPKDLTLVSAESDKIPANNWILSIFSPVVRRIISSTENACSTILLPDCSTSSLKHLLNIISNGFSLSSKVSFEEISNIISAASLLEIDLSKLTYDDVPPKTSVEKQNTAADDIANPELEEETFNMEVNAVMEEIREQISEEISAPVKVKQEKIDKQNEQTSEPPVAHKVNQESTPFQVKKEKVDKIVCPPDKLLAIQKECQICQKSESGLYALWKHYFNFHLYEDLKLKFPHLIRENSCVTCQKKFNVEKTAFQHVGILHHKLNDILISKNMMPLPTPKMASRPEDHSEATKRKHILSGISQANNLPAKEIFSPKVQDNVEKTTAENPSLEETGSIHDTTVESGMERTREPLIDKESVPNEKENFDDKVVEDKTGSDPSFNSMETEQFKENVGINNVVEQPVNENSVSLNSRIGSSESLLREDDNSPEITLGKGSNKSIEPKDQNSMGWNTFTNNSNEHKTTLKLDEDAAEFNKIRNIFSDDNAQTTSLKCQICEHSLDGAQIHKLWKHYYTSHLRLEIKTFFSHLIKDQVCVICKTKFKSEKSKAKSDYSAYQHLAINHQKINELLAIKQMMPLPLSRTMTKDSSNIPGTDDLNTSTPYLSGENTRLSSQESNLSNKTNRNSSQESSILNKTKGESSQESSPSNKIFQQLNKNSVASSNFVKKPNGTSSENKMEQEEEKLENKTSFEAIKATLQNDQNNSSGDISKNESSADKKQQEFNRKRKSIGSIISGLKFKTPKIDEASYEPKEMDSKKGGFDELKCQICRVQEINLTHIWRHYADVHFNEAIRLSDCMQGISCPECNIRKFANKKEMIRHFGLYHDKVKNYLKESGLRQLSQPKNIYMKKNKPVSDEVDTALNISREAAKELNEAAKKEINNTPNPSNQNQGIGNITLNLPKQNQSSGQDAPYSQFEKSQNTNQNKFTEEEISLLRSEYQKSKQMTIEDRAALSKKTGIDKKRISNWFIDERRKEKKKMKRKV